MWKAVWVYGGMLVLAVCAVGIWGLMAFKASPETPQPTPVSASPGAHWPALTANDILWSLERADPVATGTVPPARK